MGPVAVLGSVVLDDPLDKRWRQRRAGRIEQFWVDVTQRLKGLGNRLSELDRENVVAALNERVDGRLLTDDELQQYERTREQQMAQWRAIGAALVGTRRHRRATKTRPST